MSNTYERKWEIDLLRGIAIIFMIIFHFLYDLAFFGQLKSDVNEGFIFILGRTAALLFIVVVGISLSLSYNREFEIKHTRQRFSKFIKRGIKIFFWGMMITLVSFIFLKEGIILFGVLHFIGVGIILSYPFLKHYRFALIAAILIILARPLIQMINIANPWFLWIGITQAGFYSYDYFPIIPWLGAMLIGIYIGNIAYPQYKRKFKLPEISDFIVVRVLTYLGKRSLMIYLIHQPVLIGIFYIAGYADIGYFTL